MEQEQVSQFLSEHRADMLAVAVSMMGWCPEAEDAVQDASLTAIAKIAQLRDPDRAGAWLCSITRNVVRMHWRRSIYEVSWDPAQEPPHDRATVAPPGPDEVLERHLLRDWLWSGINQLTPALQLPVMLRYFTSLRSYRDIAAACELPLGTVKSRLNEARSQLTASLSQSAAHAGAEVTLGWSQHAAAQVIDLLRAADAGTVRSALVELTHPDVVITGPQGQVHQGRDLLALIMDSDQEAGVRQRLVNAVSSRRVSVLESRLINPAWDPDHCPPSVLWTLHHREGRVERVRLFHPA